MKLNFSRSHFVSSKLIRSSPVPQWVAALSVSGLLALAGCGGAAKGPKHEAVSGTVTREGTAVDKGSITFIPSGGGPAALGAIVDGKYSFDTTNGPVAGKQKVTITQMPLREEVPPGTPKKDAANIPDTRFKKKMPDKGWDKEAEIKTDHKDPVDFRIDE